MNNSNPMESHPHNNLVTLSDFKIIKQIGKGDVGVVYLVQKLDTFEYYAMKKLDRKKMIERKKLKRVMTEREILATTHHPLIIKFYWTFQTDSAIYFIMEYCSKGSLYKLLKKQQNKRLSESAALFYAAEVLIALEYLHMLGFLYRDLKPENILIHESGHIKLTDFDLSKAAVIRTSPKIIEKMLINTKPAIVTNSFVGTEDYIAPEIIKGCGHTSAVDWWTFGILIYEIIYGKTPFKGPTCDATFVNIIHHHIKFPADVKISKQCKDLIIHLLKFDHTKRLGSKNGAADIKRHNVFHGMNWDLILNQTPPQ